VRIRPSIQRAIGLAAACGAAALWAPGAQAADVHSYTDSQGVVHLYNVRSHKHAAATRGTDLQVPMALLDAVIAERANFYKLPPALVKAVIAVESNFNPWAVSIKGAVGLMQLMPQTAREMYIDDPYDPVKNIEAGTRYLRVLVNQFDGDLIKVLAAYNAGPDQVLKTNGALGIPPIQETQEYVRKVLRSYEAYKTPPPPSS
jgi:soluble lytic murein transglycosylase-like protein